MKPGSFFINTISSVVLCAIVTVPAYAGDDTGPYVGISANRISADFENENDVEFDDSETAVALHTGYMFNDIVGIDLSYYDLGDYQAGSTSQTRIDLDGDAFTLAGLLNLGVTDYVDLYGKLGIYYLEADSESVVAGNVLRRGEDDTAGFIAIGLAYDFGDWKIFGEFLLADTDAHNLRMDVISGGVKYEFGY